MKWIEHNGNKYPEYQASGNAARFIIPFAKEWCKGKGLDIGYGNDKWQMPGAVGIDSKDGLDAMNLPDKKKSEWIGLKPF